MATEKTDRMTAAEFRRFGPARMLEWRELDAVAAALEEGEHLRDAAAARDAVIAGLVEALRRARIPCHGRCRRNSHLTSDCPSTHFIARPCTCPCDCPAGPHNAAIDAAIAGVPKAQPAPP